MSAEPFITASFTISKQPAEGSSSWQDVSDNTTHTFTSNFGTIRLTKRTYSPETFAYIDNSGTKLAFGYGDATTAMRLLNDDLAEIPETQFTTAEFLIVIADCEQQSVAVQRDALSTLPLFIAHTGTTLTVSNQYSYVYNATPAASLHPDLDTMRSVAAGESPHKPIFKEIDALYDRVRIAWSRTGYHPTLAPGRGHTFTADFPESDPREFFDRLESTVVQYVRRYSGNDGRGLGAELSCGMDSSAICGIIIGQSASPITLASLTYTGLAQQSIRSRLDDFAGRFNTSSIDVPMDIDTDFPLSQHIDADGVFRPFYCEDDLYATATVKLAEQLRRAGLAGVLRGVGGDELFENSVPGVPVKNTPTPLLSASVAPAGLSSGNTYIEHGIWPTLPLADYALYSYCQGLPMRYRHNRDILRAYLHARKYPDSIIDTTANENFGDFFVRSVSKNLTALFAGLMQGSLLESMSLINAAESVRNWNLAVNSNDQTALFRLFRVLQLEITLRQHAGQVVRLPQTASQP